MPVFGSTAPTSSADTATINFTVGIQSGTSTFSSAPNVDQSVTWNGLDSSGNASYFSQIATIATAYAGPSAPTICQFCYMIPNLIELTPVGGYVATQIGLRGWQISVNHAYDKARNTLERGDGTSAYALSLAVGASTEVVSNDRSEVYEFDSDGRHVLTKSGVTGSTIYSFAYDSNGSLISITDGYGNVTSISYVSGVPTQITAPHGQVTSLGLNGAGLISSIGVPGSGSYLISYTTGGLIQTFQKPNGEVSTMAYDTDGFLTSDASSGGPVTTLDRYEWGTNSWETTLTTSLGRTSYYDVDQDFNSSLFSLSRTIYDPTEVTHTSSTNSKGQSNALNKNGRTHSIGTSDDPRFGSRARYTSYEVDSYSGHTRAITTSESALLNSSDPFDIDYLSSYSTVNSASSWSSFYDGSAKTFTFTSPVGRNSTRTIDGHERPTQTQFASYGAVSYTYDLHGRVSQISQGIRTSTINYNAQGYVNSVTDPLSHSTSFVYDAGGRIVSKTLPDLRTISYSYDSVGNVLSISPPTSATHQFTFNLLSMPTSYNAPSLGAGTLDTLYSYSNDRELTQITRPSGSAINFNYDASNGLLNSITAGSLTTSFIYDAHDNVNQSTSPDSVVSTYTYLGGDLGSTEYTSSGKGKVTFTYDSMLRPGTFQIGTGTAYSWLYDADELITKAGSETINRSSSTGFVSDTVVGNAREYYTYDATYGELASYQAKYTTSTNKILEAYTRDANGRIATRTVTIGTSPVDVYAYTYDLAGRLTDVTKNSVSIGHYVYDSNSNRTSSTNSGGSFVATYDSQDRLSTYGTKTFGYNLNGERTSQVDSSVSPGTTGYTWDAFGNLKQVTLPSATQINYKYDGQNRRVTKLTGTTVNERYVYLDQTRLLGVLNNAGNTQMTFFYGERSTPEYMIKSGTTYKFFVDHVGSVRQVVNTSNGTVSQEITYDEFGRVLSDSSPGFQPFGFAGGLYDSATGLTQFGARCYDAEVGRFISKDPILFNGGDTNLYGYVLQDPVNLIDITGENPVIVGAIIGGVIGAIFTPSTTDVQAPLGDAGTIGVGIAGGAALGASGAVAGSILMAPNANRYMRIGEGKFPEPFSQRISIGGQQGRKIEIGMTPAGKIDFKFGNYRTTIRPGNSCPKD